MFGILTGTIICIIGYGLVLASVTEMHEGFGEYYWYEDPFIWFIVGILAIALGVAFML